MKLSETITEAAEKVYDLLKTERYKVAVDVKKAKVKISGQRPTRHTIKWQSKNH
ncbi:MULTISPECIES: hypothetical protein [Enterococcus]|uniref:hypothetical protein n=1 Tax=Enterococcus TaxID=1350 RepID=UPI000AD466DC|nr:MULTISPECIES: hypothetical protein [Enterococcus]